MGQTQETTVTDSEFKSRSKSLSHSVKQIYMNIFESTKMAVKTLTANKTRSTLTMLGIIIGNASVITMVGIGQGAQRYASGAI